VLQEVGSFPNVTFKARPPTDAVAVMRARNISIIDKAIAAGAVDAGNEFDEAMLSTYLLSEGQAFLGSFSSNAARLAYSLMTSGPTGCLKPFESFDINWCAAFGKGGDGVLRIGDRPCSSYESELPGFFKVNAPCKIKC